MSWGPQVDSEGPYSLRPAEIKGRGGEPQKHAMKSIYQLSDERQTPKDGCGCHNSLVRTSAVTQHRKISAGMSKPEIRLHILRPRHRGITKDPTYPSLPQGTGLVESHASVTCSTEQHGRACASRATFLTTQPAGAN